MKKKGGFRRGTRSKLRKGFRQKGKVSITRFFQEFKEGERVLLKAEPSVHGGMYFPRFHGRSGTIQGKKGRCYEVLIKDIKKDKVITIHPVHLRRL
ncbi:MAG: 50S ribosomal protein L21e [Nanoarchaeota archaeon]|nr:50S ribosomal protein L21e [Nanoarchaeota archaeon]